MKYVRRNPEVLEVHQWHTPKDHERVKWYPAEDPYKVHQHCGHRWADHGWVEPGWAYHQGFYFVGDTVCPGDYLIERGKRIQVAPRRSFEAMFEPLKENENAAKPTGEG